MHSGASDPAWLRFYVRQRSDMPTEREMREYCVAQGVVPEHHCCLEMAYHVAHPVITPHQGRNRDIDWIASWNEYLIPVPLDGYSSTLIRFCPWCGSRLPSSRQREWHEALHALGFTDPGNQEIPPEYESDKWWRK